MRLFLIAWGLFLPAAALAGPGTTSEAFLSLGAGARPTAMGNAFVGLADDVNSLDYNPAGLGLLQRQELTLSDEELADSTHHEWLAYALPTGRLGTFGVSINMLMVDAFASYDQNDNPTGNVSAMDGAYGISYGISPLEGLSFGGTAKIISSRLASTTAETAAFDGGALYRPSSWLGLGASVLNAGSGLHYIQETDPLPLSGRVGFSLVPYETGDSKVTLTCDGQFTRAGPAQVFGGIEVLVLEGLALRGGGHSGLNNQPGFTAGAGLVLNREASGRPMISFDYALVDQGTLGYTNEGSITVRFGRPKRELAEGEEPQEKEGSDEKPPEDEQPEPARSWRDLQPAPSPKPAQPSQPPSNDVLHDLLQPPPSPNP